MLHARLDLATMARIRVAPSPVFETVMWLGLTTAGVRHPLFGDPGSAARFALRDRDIAAVALLTTNLVAKRALPDFLTPSPSAVSPERMVADQIEKVRSTSPDDAHEQLTGPPWNSLSLGRHGIAGAALPAVAAAGLWKFWRTVMADDWPTLRGGLNPWVTRFGQRSAEAGLEAALNDLHPTIGWDDDTLLLDCPCEDSVHLVDRELALVPSALTLPHTSAQTDSTSDAMLVFPVRASLPARRVRQNPSAALGRGRSSVLVGLGSPRTTRQLARAVGLAESTVSHHLRTLADADLVQAVRRGPEVVYSLTRTGRDLRRAIET